MRTELVYVPLEDKTLTALAQACEAYGAVAQSGTSRENAELLTNQATEKFPQSVDRSSILYSLSAQPSE
jgi:hypothetical protein